jgi:ATP-dependent exoDNAse (exonuclease V) beta subunit
VTPLVDDDARRAIREDLDATLFVEAAAGTGKTTALVTRIVNLLRSGRSTGSWPSPSPRRQRAR